MRIWQNAKFLPTKKEVLVDLENGGHFAPRQWVLYFWRGRIVEVNSPVLTIYEHKGHWRGGRDWGRMEQGVEQIKQRS